MPAVDTRICFLLFELSHEFLCLIACPRCLLARSCEHLAGGDLKRNRNFRGGGCESLRRDFFRLICPFRSPRAAEMFRLGCTSLKAVVRPTHRVSSALRVVARARVVDQPSSFLPRSESLSLASHGRADAVAVQLPVATYSTTLPRYNSAAAPSPSPATTIESLATPEDTETVAPKTYSSIQSSLHAPVYRAVTQK